MADAKFSIGQLNITGNLRVIAREVANPLVEVANIIYTAPHPSIRNIIITGLNAKPHYFDFYETSATSGSSPIGTLIARHYQDLGLLNEYTVLFYEFIVGATGAPVEGDVDYTNTDLADLETDNIQVVQRSIGPRSWTDEIDFKTGGGFTLLNGEKFSNDDRWFITAIKKSTVVTPPSISAVYSSVKIENSDFTIDSTYYNSLILLYATTGWVKATMPDLSTIPDLTKFTFNLQQGTATGLIIDIPNGTLYPINGIEDSKFYLRKYEVATFIVYQGTLILIDGKGNWDKVGHQVSFEARTDGVFTDKTTIQEVEQWIDIDDEPRLFYWYVNKLPSTYLATNFSSYSELGKWAIDLPNNRFRTPESRGRAFLHDSGVTPGSQNYRAANTSAPTSNIVLFNTAIFSRIL